MIKPQSGDREPGSVLHSPAPVNEVGLMLLTCRLGAISPFLMNSRSLCNNFTIFEIFYALSVIVFPSWSLRKRSSKKPLPHILLWMATTCNWFILHLLKNFEKGWHFSWRFLNFRVRHDLMHGGCETVFIESERESCCTSLWAMFTELSALIFILFISHLINVSQLPETRGHVM